MALLQQQGIAAPGGQALYANPYNQQSTQSQSGYAGYESQGWPTGADGTFLHSFKISQPILIPLSQHHKQATMHQLTEPHQVHQEE